MTQGKLKNAGANDRILPYGLGCKWAAVCFKCPLDECTYSYTRDGRTAARVVSAARIEKWILAK